MTKPISQTYVDAKTAPRKKSVFIVLRYVQLSSSPNSFVTLWIWSTFCLGAKLITVGLLKDVFTTNCKEYFEVFDNLSTPFRMQIPTEIPR